MVLRARINFAVVTRRGVRRGGGGFLRPWSHEAKFISTLQWSHEAELAEASLWTDWVAQLSYTLFKKTLSFVFLHSSYNNINHFE